MPCHRAVSRKGLRRYVGRKPSLPPLCPKYLPASKLPHRAVSLPRPSSQLQRHSCSRLHPFMDTTPPPHPASLERAPFHHPTPNLKPSPPPPLSPHFPFSLSQTTSLSLVYYLSPSSTEPSAFPACLSPASKGVLGTQQVFNKY